MEESEWLNEDDNRGEMRRIKGRCKWRVWGYKMRSCNCPKVEHRE